MATQHGHFDPAQPRSKFSHLPLSSSGPLDCALTGTALLETPYFNKGAAFSTEERKTFNLTGLLPQNVQTLEQQVKRAYEQYSSRRDDLAKNTFMTSMKEQNDVLYFKVRECNLRLYHNFNLLVIVYFVENWITMSSLTLSSSFRIILRRCLV